MSNNEFLSFTSIASSVERFGGEITVSDASSPETMPAPARFDAAECLTVESYIAWVVAAPTDHAALELEIEVLCSEVWNAF